MLHKRVTIIEDRTVEQFKRNRNFKHHAPKVIYKSSITQLS